MKEFASRSFLIRNVLLMTLFIGSTQISLAQKKEKAKSQPVPEWIKMMDEPRVNYYKAVKAFENYWKGKVTPVEEDELFGAEENEERKRELHERKGHLSKNDPAVKYAFEYKRFQHWRQVMAPFVKPDGTVKTMQERLDDWKKEKEQRNIHQFKPQKAEKGKE